MGDAAWEMGVLDFSWFLGHVGVSFFVGGLSLGLMSMGLLGMHSCWHVWHFGHFAGGALCIHFGFSCCASILIFLLSSNFTFSFSNSRNRSVVISVVVL